MVKVWGRPVDIYAMKLLAYGIAGSLLAYAAGLWALLRRDSSSTA